MAMSSRNQGIVIAVVSIILLSVAGGYYAFNGKSAYVECVVYSTHITEEVDVIIYIDGKAVDTCTDLKPGGSYHSGYYYRYVFPIWEKAKLIEVKAKSVGGGIGPQTDTESIIVENHGFYTVYLFV